MSVSNYAENAIMDLLFNGGSFTGLATVYTKLHIGDPGEAGTGNAAGETTRKATTFGASANGVVTSDADIAWTNVSTGETYSHISLWDASTAGNCLWVGALTTPVAVTVGSNFTIPSGSLTVTLD